MDVDEILAELRVYGKQVPRAALAAAAAQREAITPYLVRAVEHAVEHPQDELANEDDATLSYALYLLAEFRETRAYPLYIRLGRLPGELPLDLTGDILTEDFARMLAAVWGGDLGPIKGLAEDASVNEYVRSKAVGTLAVLVACGELPRADAIAYYRELFEGGLEREPAFVWGSLVCACLDLHAEELLDHIRQAYEDRLVDPFHVGEDDVDQELARGRTPALERLRQRRFRLIEDAADAVRWWNCFQRPPRRRPARPTRPPKQRKRAEPPRPAFPRGWDEKGEAPAAAAPPPGRNDPCPCGSGRKYKKCCGRPQQ